jgi:hypothetical protein
MDPLHCSIGALARYYALRADEKIKAAGNAADAQTKWMPPFHDKAVWCALAESSTARSLGVDLPWMVEICRHVGASSVYTII